MRMAAVVVALAISAPAYANSNPGTKTQPSDGKEKLVCKREVPVGSLIASRKTCMTKAQWEAQARDGNEEARRMIELNQGRPTGN
jgi:hypothetical protein